jgi:hypothetical protein
MKIVPKIIEKLISFPAGVSPLHLHRNWWQLFCQEILYFNFLIAEKLINYDMHAANEYFCENN